MKVIIAGSRTITDYDCLVRVIEASGFEISEVVCGMAQGVDLLGFRYAQSNNLPIAQFPADWTAHGRAAGHIRNKQMALYADALIALWDGRSKGTGNMITIAVKHGLKVHVETISPPT